MKKIIILLFVTLTVLAVSAAPVCALTESEVQAQVDAVGREAVTGNILVWFLCAVAFLKVSQKIDSFMSSLGINVGHTGGSMMAEMLIAARGVAAAGKFVGHGGGGGGSSGGGGSASQSGGSTFLQGGLAGAVSRTVERSAVKSANGSKPGGLGGAVYNASVQKGGGFANRVIGKIATGRIANTGTISGANAPEALLSYLGYSSVSEENRPVFSDVEMGGGHIFATETAPEHPEGIPIGLYHAEQYLPPEGEYTTVTATDGTAWYKQYAVDAVERTPYEAPDGAISYQEHIVKRLPKAPPRKDRL